MLRYSIKPIAETNFSTFPFYDFYVSPDVDYISGVTDYNIGLVNSEEVLIKSPYIENGSESNTLIVKEALRQGRLEVEIELKVNTITKTLNFNVYNSDSNDEDNAKTYIYAYNNQIEVPDELTGEDEIYSSVTQNYVSYNGDISYFFSGDTPNNCGYSVNNIFYKASKDDETIKVKSYLYIDDGKLVVGDNVYYADFSKLPTNPNLKPELRLSRYVSPITGGSYLGDIDGLSYYAASAPDGSIAMDEYTQDCWKKINTFKIIKKVNPYLGVDDVLYGRYKHYITIGDKNYFFKDVFTDGEYIGHGILADGKFYTDEALEGAEEIVSDKVKEDLENDYRNGVELAGRYVNIKKYNKSFLVKNEIASSDRKGIFLIVILKDEKLDIIPGDILNAESADAFYIAKEVQEDEAGTWYVEYMGSKYDVKKKLFDVVVLSNNEYRLSYTDNSYTAATASVNGDDVYFLIRYFLTDDCASEISYDEYEESSASTKNIKATISKEVYYKECDGTPTIVRLDIHNNAYKVIENSGVTIGDTIYKINEYTSVHNDMSTQEDEEVPNSASNYFVSISSTYNFKLLVSDIIGSSTLICYPVVEDGLYSEKDSIDISRDITKIIMDNKEHFYFTLRKDTFGREVMNAENGLAASMSSIIPYSTTENNKLEKSIKIYRKNGHLSFKFPLTVNTANNLMREDTINGEFVDYVKERSINKIVDMEKDVYYPVWRSGNSESGYKYNPIREIRFNLHFRTRNLENWKVIEDDREYSEDPFDNNTEFYTYNSTMCNWFVTDYEYYSNESGPSDGECTESEYIVDKKCLHNSSDLLGYLNFTDSEVMERASKLRKSFLRLSFYSTNDPQTQVLLGTSTVFLDENMALAKLISLKKSSNLSFIDTALLKKAGYKSVCEYLTDAGAEYQVTANTTNATSELIGDMYLNDSFRLSSRFTILDKYNSDFSSEGYYLYMFKEYTKKNREGIIYMKVDFNHAGIGQSIPFFLPRKGIESDGVGRPLYLHNNNDVKTLKNGFKLKDIYKQLYLPIYVIFDTNTNKYVYYLPENLRENGELSVNDQIMEFNLFEVKFENESLVNTNENNQ